MALLAGFAAHSQGTGFYGPNEYFAQGGKNVSGSPEFYWELEVKRLARDYHPAEKLLDTSTTAGVKAARSDGDKLTTDADGQDFAAALKEGKIKPPDLAKASDQHDAARTAIGVADDKTTTPLPTEFDSEFADYHRGAYAYRLGKDHWEEARKAWEALLKRPEAERHYRTVWATFMLGKMAMKKGDPAAVKYFQQVRELAKAGFADSLGMAADSYGWEGRSEWKQGHPEKAAPLFLTQLALGDESAVVSLKALVPDREPVEGMLNYGPELDDEQKWSDQEKRAHDAKAIQELKTAAADPLLRRLVTAHILATDTAVDAYSDMAARNVTHRSARWLSVIKEAKLAKVEDAEYLGWVAYTDGDYKGAAKWLAVADGESPAASWLRAKLQLREGKLDDAAKNMAKAWQSVSRPADYTGWMKDSDEKAIEDTSSEYLYFPDGGSYSFTESASGDLGGMHLARGDFVQAMDVLLKGGLWTDAAFVAERVLTADELKAYVDKQPAPPEAAPAPDRDNNAALKYLLGRRLVREDRYAEAAGYMKPPYDKILRKYVQALNDGANEKLPKLKRAEAWFTAAWLARFDGMELMGTEVSPDGFDSEGAFPDTDIAQQREKGAYEEVKYETVTNKAGEQEEVQKTVTHPLALKPSKEELQRLAKNKISPDLRFHYRMIAGALAVRAAGFMQDNSEELADVLNTAGGWVKDRDEKTGDRYFLILKKRCSDTKIGKAAIAKHWFTDVSGPWSDARQTAYDAMHKELAPPDKPQE